MSDFIPRRTVVYNDNQNHTNIQAFVNWEEENVTYVATNSHSRTEVRRMTITGTDFDGRQFVHGVGDSPINAGIENSPPGSATHEMVVSDASGVELRNQLRPLTNATASSLYDNQGNGMDTIVFQNDNQTVVEVADKAGRELGVHVRDTGVMLADGTGRKTEIKQTAEGINVSDGHGDAITVKTTTSSPFSGNAQGLLVEAGGVTQNVMMHNADTTLPGGANAGFALFSGDGTGNARLTEMMINAGQYPETFVIADVSFKAEGVAGEEGYLPQKLVRRRITTQIGVNGSNTITQTTTMGMATHARLVLADTDGFSTWFQMERKVDGNLKLSASQKTSAGDKYPSTEITINDNNTVTFSKTVYGDDGEGKTTSVTVQGV